MKAAVIFINLLIACSSHVINKRSLLGGDETHGHGHHGDHHQHREQHHRARNAFGHRVGRDGGHHNDESENEIRSADSGYLPAADDYEDDLAGYNARSEDLAGYGDDNLAGFGNGDDGQAEGRGQAQYRNDQQQYGDGQENYKDGNDGQAEGRGQDEYGDDQEQFGDDQEQYQDDQYQYEESSGAEPKNAEVNLNSEEAYSAPAVGSASDFGRSAGDGYGAPDVESASIIDRSYAAPDAGRAADDGYAAPDAGRAADDGYAAPDAGKAADDGYAAPDDGRAADDGYAAPEEGSGAEGAGYTVPEEASADDSYAAGAESDYSAPRAADDEYGAPGQYAANQNGVPFASVEGRQDSAAVSGNEEARLCPGGSLDVCVSVCPGITARVYGACVQGCADRCPQF